MTAGVGASQQQTGVAWSQIVSILKPWRWLLLAIALVVMAGASLELIPPLLMRQIVDEHLTLGQPEGLLQLALLYLGASALVQGLGFLTNYLTAVTAQGALNELRVRLFAHLQQLPMHYYDRTPLGDIISRCTADVETLDTLFSSGVAGLVADLFRLVTISITMVALSPRLALVSVLVAPPLLWITNHFRVRIRDAERANRLAIGVLNTHLQEVLGGVEVIRAFGREAVFVARFRRALKQALAAFNRSTAYNSFYPPLMNSLSALGTALLLWLGTGTLAQLAQLDISLGTLTAFVLLFRRFFAPITALGDEWQTVQSALSGAERIFQVLGLPVEQSESGGRAVGGADHGPVIALDKVSFGYLAERPVLQDMTLQVRAGEHVALVGRTGAGKTSTLHLLGGLYTPWSGQVRIAGVDPRAVSDEERRRVLGVVPQVVQLFSGSILENLTLGDATVSREEVEQAARMSGADAFIRALPQGYDTPLGKGAGGVQLSAGQRQLLALTRALVWNPPALLLDEATSAVDSVSELVIREALRAGLAGQRYAVLTVAHRLSTAREADWVIVLEAGRIIEQGRPAELITRGGHFAALVELEAAGWEWRNSALSTA